MTSYISVIVPVYNAESYIGRCIESIQTQTYTNFELIIVDDGSMDKSGAMCDMIASQDSRVHVIHQKNAGAGAARNAGLAIANGEYIVFVDSDDMIRDGYFELLAQHDEDVVFINVDNIDERGKLVKHEYMSQYRHYSVDDIIRYQMTGKLPWGGVRKCVKRQLIKDNNICYSNHKIGEEAIYSYQVLRYAKSVGFIDQPVYCYMLRRDSLSSSKVEDPWGSVALSLRSLIKEQGDYIRYAQTLNSFINTACAVSIFRIAQYNSYHSFAIKAKKRVTMMIESIDKNYQTDWKYIDVPIKIILGLMRLRCWYIIWLGSRLKK